MTSVVEIYKAMADESRLRIISMLGQGTFNVQEITTVLELSQSTVSHHLRTLQHAGVVTHSREGTWAYYSLGTGDGTVRAVVDTFLESVRSNGASAAFGDDRRRARALIEKRRDATRNYFDRVAAEWRDLRGEALGGAEALQEIVRRIPERGTLLELGCGSGALLEKILPREGVTVAVDYSPAMLEQARAALGQRAEGVDFRLGYLEHLPLADHSVDLAVAYMVFHHLSSPQEALQDAARVLAPGGSLMIVDLTQHNREQMRERYAHLWLGFEVAEFSRWMSAAGFSDIEHEVFGSQREVFLIRGKRTVNQH